MREMIDNPDLPTLAANFLSYITAVTPPIHLVEPLIQILVQTLRESTVSAESKIGLHKIFTDSVSCFHTVLEDPYARAACTQYNILQGATIDL